MAPETRAEALDAHLAQLAALEPDWDSYGARTISEVAVAATRSFLEPLFDVPAPQLFPVCHGGLQAEWPEGGGCFEVEIHADGRLEYYFEDARPGSVGGGEDASAEVVYRELREWLAGET